MHYQVRVSRASGDIVALCLVVDAMAKARATAFGAAEFHRPTFDGALVDIRASLLNEAKKGCLQVCDQNGFAASADELIAQAKRTGSFSTVSRRVVEPDWDALKERHPDRELPFGVWNWTGIDLGESEVDEVSSELFCLYATLKHLNDWGASAGNSFSLDPNAPPWIDERGVMGLSENPAAGGEATVTQKGGAEGTINGNPNATTGVTAATKSHRIGTRTNILAPVIELAKSKAILIDDASSVWAVLVQLAESKDRPAPLLGFVDGEGVKYQGENGPEFFTLKNLRDRMNRKRNKAR